MEIDASVPKALYQANIDLALRIAALLQESGAQWFDLFADEANARLQEATAQGKQPAAAGKPMSPDMALKWMQANPGRWQALLMQAANNQSRFAEGLQAALQQWQAACSDTLGAAAMEVFPGAPAGLESLPGWQEMTGLMQGFIARFVPQFEASSATKATPRKPAESATAPQPVTAKSPAAKSPARKASARKTAPSKPAKPAVTPEPVVTKSSAAKTAGKKSARKPAQSGKVGKTDAKTTSAPSKAGKTPSPAPTAVTRSRRSKKSDS